MIARASGSPRLWTRSSQRQIEFYKLNFRENARSRTDHGADIITWLAPQDENNNNSNRPQLHMSSFPHHHPTPRSVSLNESLVSAGCVSPPSATSFVEEVWGGNRSSSKGS